MNMLSTDDLLFFMALTPDQTLADAARRLDVTPSAVTQRLSAMERRLGIQLVDRSGRRIALTDEGELLAERARSICAQLSGLADTLASRRGQVAGQLRVLAPLGFGQRHIAPLVGRFQQQYPEVTATLMLSDRPQRLDAHHWDVLIHIGELRDSSLIMHRLAKNRRILCAAPAYLKRQGTPASPEDLHHHDCIALRENDEDVTLWRLSSHDGGRATVRIEPRLASNDGGVALQWALSGLGILARSEWDVAEALRDGKLLEVLPGWRLPDADIVALVSSRKSRSARTERFLEQLHEMATPWLADSA
ncbi:LysR family transcriptional regulator [Bordetella avium]|nr:LysR family transcriptional regulator [Bordetella avium]